MEEIGVRLALHLIAGGAYVIGEVVEKLRCWRGSFRMQVLSESGMW